MQYYWNHDDAVFITWHGPGFHEKSHSCAILVTLLLNEETYYTRYGTEEMAVPQVLQHKFRNVTKSSRTGSRRNQTEQLEIAEH